MNKRNFIIAMALFLCLKSIAQEDTTDLFYQMNKRYENTMQQMDDRYLKTREQMQKEYDDYMSRKNAEFQKYLKSSFKEFEKSPAEEKPNTDPKPVEQPKFEPKVEKAEPVVSKPPKEEIKVEILSAASHSLTPITNEPKDASGYAQGLSVDFFSGKVNLSIDSRMKSLKLNAVTPEAFAQYWEKFTQIYYQTYIISVTNYANQTNLNDWGVYKLMENTSKMLFSSLNNQNMWLWAMLNQAGYRVKIAYNQNQTTLLLPIIQEVYEKPYFIIAGTKYYMLNEINNNKLLTYSEDFAIATKTIDLHLPNSLSFSGEANYVEKSTLLPDEAKSLRLKLDKTTIGFLASYPQTENSVYLNAAMSNTIKETLFESLQVQLKDKSETDAVGYLLSYLHKSFEYKTDNDQFGKEKTFFPDEMFYYPYSDCEDRTVLFTKLVSSLLGLDVIAVLYRDHMAAAVAFTDPVEGHNFIVDGKTYTICDPTYLNAPIGSVMPRYKDYKPQAIKINNNSMLNNIWQHISQTIEKNNQGKIFINNRAISENGKFIVSGWFSDNISINGKFYSPYNNTRDLWFATFNKLGRLEWFLPIECSGYSFTQAIAVGRKGEVYAHINYNGSINVNHRKLYTSDITSQLVLGISSNADVVFMKTSVFRLKKMIKLHFMLNISPMGQKSIWFLSRWKRFILILK